MSSWYNAMLEANEMEDPMTAFSLLKDELVSSTYADTFNGNDVSLLTYIYQHLSRMYGALNVIPLLTHPPGHDDRRGNRIYLPFPRALCRALDR
jgi:hypothetical protein